MTDRRLYDTLEYRDMHFNDRSHYFERFPASFFKSTVRSDTSTRANIQKIKFKNLHYF